MLNLLRSILHLLWMAVTIIPWGSMVVVLSLFMRGSRLYWFATCWLRMAIHGARWILGIRVQVAGMENLPDGNTSPAVLLAKHQSTFETFLLPTLMPHPLAYVFKRELIYVPFFGWAIARLDMVHIDRSQRAAAFNKVVEQGKRLLSQGVWVTMFPEGTRTERGGQGKYKSGGTRLAVAAGVPVIPIAITSGQVWPRKAFIKKPGVVYVSIGRPIPSEGRDPEDLLRDVEAWIEAEMRRLDPEAYLPVPAPTANEPVPAARA